MAEPQNIKDVLFLRRQFTVGDDEFTVVTENLSVPHGPERTQHYETRVNGTVQVRYETQGAAENGHETVVSKLKGGQYRHEVIATRLVIE